ncbi:MAG: hypothetical protein BGO10_02435 [Chlamydia sp. 32-24]|nr:MAG: hypothetical protein BGO10_02435 [Chlamydia sp. 32-24]
MSYLILILSIGFALFSMFFGSGNLVFPISLGYEVGSNYEVACIGLLITAVFIPFFGVYAMWLYKGDTKAFFSTMGPKANFWLSFLILSIISPFGVLARCITVAHGSFYLLAPDVSLPVFSLIFCAILYLVTYKESQIVSILGTYLTPFLLLSLSIIAYFGFKADGYFSNNDLTSLQTFKSGFYQGYQTMDLLAAFFFSSFILKHIDQLKHPTKSVAEIFKHSLYVGAFLLSIIYVTLIYLGAKNSTNLIGVAPQQMLGTIAYQAMGALSAPVVCIALILACFTTAVVLAKLYAEFFQSELAKNKVSNSTAMIITLAIAFFVSTFEFSGIARFLSPLLEAIYPSLIVLTFFNVLSKKIGIKNYRWPIVATLIGKICFF